MATPLGTTFSTAENQVSQNDDQTLGSIAETLIIHFDQEKFEQLLSGGSKNPLHVRKHRKASIAKVPLATFGKQVSIEAIEVSARLDRFYASLNRLRVSLNMPREPIIVPTGTKLAPRQHTNVARETMKAQCEPKMASNKAM